MVRQVAAAAGAFVVMSLLAHRAQWPFHQRPIDLGESPSLWEVLLNDRLTLGLLRAGLAAIVTYVVVSVPALVVGGRWMKGLTTAGMTADDAVSAHQEIEDLQRGLRAIDTRLQDEVTKEVLSQWVVQLQAENERLRAEIDERPGGRDA